MPLRMVPAALALVLVAGACASSPAAEGPATTTARPSAPVSTDEPSPSSTVAPTSSNQPSTDEPAAATDPLLAMELVDVRSGTGFTLGELASDGPLIVETMAIWCTNCREQQSEVRAAHGLADFHSVSIDVDPTEIAEDLSAYAGRESFDWPFALADADLATMLRDRFGTAVLNPPSMPKLLVRPDGSVELLPLGELMSAEEIAALVAG